MSDPLDDLRQAVHQLDTCDRCDWVITSAAAYDRHLEREHPQYGLTSR